MTAWLRRLPLAVGALGLAVPALLLVANLVRGAVAPGSTPYAFGPRLDGVAVPVTPVLSAATLLGGDFQAKAALAIGPLVPVQRWAVRLKDQVWYAALNAPGVPFVVVSRGRTLVELAYLQEYCTRDEAAFRTAATAWLPQLRGMQDRVERRGQTFLYVLTPSKMSYNPALVPAGYPCRATAAARAGLVATWRRMLDGAGIHYVDTTALITAAKPQYPFPLYPRGGTHWNMIGAAMAAQAIGTALNTLRHDTAFAPFTYDWTLTHDPQYPDDDLALLMNLIWPDRDYPVPHLTFHTVTPPPPCHPVNIAMVGGSFMHQFAQVLSGGACHPHLEQWEYWQIAHLTWPHPGELYEVAALDDAARRADVLGADVVLYEENEQNMARSNHGPAFARFLAEAGG